jgi:GntR family transcriptional regulator
MNFRIDRQSGEAAYRQLEHLIVSSIKEGVYREGMKIPSEVALAKKLGISRMTVNKALTSLARRGFSTRSPGRGSIVTPRKLHQGFFKITSFNRTMSETGMTPETRVLETGIIPAGKAVAEALSIDEGSPVVLVRRLRIADGVPLMLETRYLNHTYCHPILDENLSIGSIHDILINKFNLPLTRVRQSLEARKASKKEAALLEIREKDCCFFMVRTTFTDDIPISWVQYLYRSDRYRFAAEFNPMEEFIGE